MRCYLKRKTHKVVAGLPLVQILLKNPEVQEKFVYLDFTELYLSVILPALSIPDETNDKNTTWNSLQPAATDINNFLPDVFF